MEEEILELQLQKSPSVVTTTPTDNNSDEPMQKKQKLGDPFQQPKTPGQMTPKINGESLGSKTFPAARHETPSRMTPKNSLDFDDFAIEQTKTPGLMTPNRNLNPSEEDDNYVSIYLNFLTCFLKYISNTSNASSIKYRQKRRN